MGKWWNTWGGTVLALAGALGSAIGAYWALERRIDRLEADIALRLQRIEIVLRIDPMTRDVPIRTASDTIK